MHRAIWEELGRDDDDDESLAPASKRVLLPVRSPAINTVAFLPSPMTEFTESFKQEKHSFEGGPLVLWTVLKLKVQIEL